MLPHDIPGWQVDMVAPQHRGDIRWCRGRGCGVVCVEGVWEGRPLSGWMDAASSKWVPVAGFVFPYDAFPPSYSLLSSFRGCWGGVVIFVVS